jgi:hypothetical protein
LGLDATVYLRGHGVDDDDCADHQAIHRRLGNASGVGYLRQRASNLLPSNSIILEKVICSGTHAGDEFAVELVASLKEELAVLADDADPHMRAFVRSMSELASAAVEQGNPICF